MRNFENALKDFPMAQQRKMFGFPAAFINGNMFTSLFNDKMIVRLSPTDATKLPHSKQFEPMPGRQMTGRFVLPPQILNSPKELKVWMVKAFAYAKVLPAKGNKK